MCEHRRKVLIGPIHMLWIDKHCCTNCIGRVAEYLDPDIRIHFIGLLWADCMDKLQERSSDVGLFYKNKPGTTAHHPDSFFRLLFAHAFAKSSATEAFIVERR